MCFHKSKIGGAFIAKPVSEIAKVLGEGFGENSSFKKVLPNITSLVSVGIRYVRPLRINR